ncbi:MAG: nucleotide exchange factor GrpE [Alphaproteobacteria bacterium]|nr:nucleotide exchange factor GrpE [Alphaproteobacteria bacterium]
MTDLNKPSDGDNKPEKNPAAADDAAHKSKMDELFGDLDDEGDTPEDTIESLRAERDELLQKLADMSTRIARSQADNLKLMQANAEGKKIIARLEGKAEEDKKFAAEKFIKDILPVVDTMELGLKSIEQKHRDEDPKFDKLAKGVELTLSQLTAVFNRYGVKQINPEGEEFDANKHEAITAQEKEGVDPETVIHVAQKGYEINGRVIRPAKVVVTPPG